MARLMRRVHKYTSTLNRTGVVSRAKYYARDDAKIVRRIFLVGGKVLEIGKRLNAEFVLVGGVGSIRLPVPNTSITTTGIPVINAIRNTLVFPITNGCIRTGSNGGRILAIEYEEDNTLDFLIPSRTKGDDSSITMVFGEELFEIFATLDIPQMEVCRPKKPDPFRSSIPQMFASLRGETIHFKTRKRSYNVCKNPSVASAMSSAFDMLTITV